MFFRYLEREQNKTLMKNFKTILIVTLILDVLQYIPLIIAKTGGAMQEQMISDLGIEGLADSAAGMQVLDVMLYIFGFIMAGTIAAVVYSLTLKSLEGLKAATFVLFIIHLFWTLPDFVTLLSGGSQHPPIIFMVLTLIPIIGLFYVSRNGIVKS